MRTWRFGVLAASIFVAVVGMGRWYLTPQLPPLPKTLLQQADAPAAEEPYRPLQRPAAPRARVQEPFEPIAVMPEPFEEPPPPGDEPGPEAVHTEHAAARAVPSPRPEPRRPWMPYADAPARQGFSLEWFRSVEWSEGGWLQELFGGSTQPPHAAAAPHRGPLPRVDR